MSEPYAACTIDLTGCEWLSRDVEGIEKVAAQGSNGPTEVIYLYAGKPPADIVMGIKPLAWKLNSETQTVAEVFFGRYIVGRNPSDRWCWGLSFHGEQGVGLYPVDNFEAAKIAAQADYQQRIMSTVEDHLSVGDVLETAARAGDAAVYEAMRSETFDPSIPDNVAEFVGNAIRAAPISSLSGVENAPQAPTSNHVNGGAYRKVSAEEWRALGGDDNKFCDWHEGIGYVVYDDLALEQYLAKTANLPAPAKEVKL